MDPNHDVAALRQALWDIYGILGEDQDGDETPAAVANLIEVVKNAAQEARGKYDAILEII